MWVRSLDDAVGHEEQRIALMQIEGRDRKISIGDDADGESALHLDLGAVEIRRELAGVGDDPRSIRVDAQDQAGRNRVLALA